MRWITNELATAPYDSVVEAPGLCRLDVRSLVDGEGNPPRAIRQLIEEALSNLRGGKRVVICCDYGISRSNAIAAGVFSLHYNVSLHEATRRVIDATGETALKIEVLSAVHRAISAATFTPPGEDKLQFRVLVTGSTGFIGKALVPHLCKNYALVCPPRHELNLVQGAAMLDLAIKQHGVTTIVHLASPRVYTTNAAMGDSLVMLKNVLDACRENQTRLIYLSSWEVFSGYRTTDLHADESLAPCPGQTYGQIKLLCESLIAHFSLHHGLRTTIIRSGPIYGPGSDRPRFIFNYWNKAIRNQEIVTHRYRNGFPALDLLYIDDLVAALLGVIARAADGTFHVGTGIATKTADVARQIVALTGSGSSIHHADIARDTGNIRMDARQAQRALNWSPTVMVEEGLRSLISHVTERSGDIKGQG